MEIALLVVQPSSPNVDIQSACISGLESYVTAFDLSIFEVFYDVLGVIVDLSHVIP